MGEWSFIAPNEIVAARICLFLSLFIFSLFFSRKRFKMDGSGWGEVITPYKVPEGQKTLAVL